MRMNEEVIRQTLRRWNGAMQECDARMDQLAELTGQVVESPLGDAVYHVMGEYTKTVADLIEWDDGLLSDWWTSHQFGDSPMEICFAGEPMQHLSTIEQFTDFIIDDLQRGEL